MLVKPLIRGHITLKDVSSIMNRLWSSNLKRTRTFCIGVHRVQPVSVCNVIIICSHDFDKVLYLQLWIGFSYQSRTTVHFLEMSSLGTPPQVLVTSYYIVMYIVMIELR